MPLKAIQTSLKQTILGEMICSLALYHIFAEPSNGLKKTSRLNQLHLFRVYDFFMNMWQDAIDVWLMKGVNALVSYFSDLIEAKVRFSINQPNIILPSIQAYRAVS